MTVLLVRADDVVVRLLDIPDAIYHYGLLRIPVLARPKVFRYLDDVPLEFDVTEFVDTGDFVGRITETGVSMIPVWKAR